MNMTDFQKLLSGKVVRVLANLFYYTAIAAGIAGMVLAAIAFLFCELTF